MRRIVATEALALGAISVTIGGVLSLLTAWALVRFVFELPFDPPWGELAALSGAVLGVTTLVGAASGRTSRSRSALAALREADGV